MDGLEHVLAPGPDLALATLRDDSDADEDVVALRGLGRGFESNRFSSLATDSEDDEVEWRTFGQRR